MPELNLEEFPLFLKTEVDQFSVDFELSNVAVRYWDFERHDEFGRHAGYTRKFFGPCVGGSARLPDFHQTWH
jgi:hypothetical protein